MEMLHPAFQTTMIDIDVLDEVHTPCTLAFVLIESNVTDAHRLRDSFVATVDICAEDGILTEYRLHLAGNFFGLHAWHN